ASRRGGEALSQLLQTRVGALLNNPILFNIGVGTPVVPPSALAPNPVLTRNLGHAAAPFTGPTQADRDKELADLAKLRDLGKLREQDATRLNALVAELQSEEAKTTDLDRRRVLAEQIASLTREQKQAQVEVTDAQRQELELIKAQAQEAGKLLKVELDRRNAIADSRREQDFRAALQQTGGVGNFEELIARQRARPFESGVDTSRLSASEQAARRRQELLADAALEAEALQETETSSIDVMENIGQSIRENIADSLVSAFEQGKNAAGAFFRAILDGIKQVAAQLLAADITASIFRLIGGGIPHAPSGPLAGADAGGNIIIPRLATGGPLRGVGSGISDSNLFWGSRGEWIHTARAVDHYGSPFMRAIDLLQIPKFAAGGLIGGEGQHLPDLLMPTFHQISLVGAAPMPAQGGGSMLRDLGQLRMLVELDPGLILRTMASPEGQAVQFDVFERQKRAYRERLEDA
ncbi:MAG: hypothetical protein ACREL3_08135, partial [Gemmatimonadales bacterium]